MRLTLIYSLLSIALFGCSGSSSRDEQEGTSEINLETTEIDSVYERNNPNALDLTKYQLFIDTTRNSEFYENFFDRGQAESMWDMLSSQFFGINANHKIVHIDLKTFPKKFVQLERLNGELVVYDLCHYMAPRIQILDSAVYFSNSMEPDLEPIIRLFDISEKAINLELRTYKAKNGTGSEKLKIEKLNEKLYRCILNEDSSYVTPFDYLNQFNMLKGHCPDELVVDRVKFDTE